MAALTSERMHNHTIGECFPYDVAASSKIFSGGIVVLDADGNAKAASTATALRAVGVCKETVDNSGGAAGALIVEVLEGVYAMKNSASGDLITKADIGKACYLVDDQTVAKTDNSAARSFAGFVRFIDAEGVWVEFRNYFNSLTLA